MINSLGKDSHTTTCNTFAMKNSVANSGALVDLERKYNPHFNGIAAARLANTKQVDELVDVAQKTLGKNVKFKKYKNFYQKLLIFQLIKRHR